MNTLYQQIERLKSPIVVGLDPTYEMMPSFLKEEALETYGKCPKAVAEMFFTFNQRIIDAIADIVPAVKPQIAFYERYGLDGLEAYQRTCTYAKEKGLLVIGDIKRGDIASTAAGYASHLSGITIEGEHFHPWQEDGITVNPYLGSDGIHPFITAAKESKKFIFVLLRTSNPSSKELQELDCGGDPLYIKVAQLITTWGNDAIESCGYSRVGAVVGATQKEQGKVLRKLMPNTFFLVPGYGAQGATTEDLKGFFDANGNGCIVNSSRGIIMAYQKDTRFSEQQFDEAARCAASTMQKELRNLV